MTGREIMEKIKYLGQEKALRKLAVKDHLADTEKIACMTGEEVCDLISKKYECVWDGKEDLGHRYSGDVVRSGSGPTAGMA